MDVFECIKTRPAVRSFRPDPISPEIVKKILRAGQQAHSQRNRQPWHFIAIENKEMLKHPVPGNGKSFALHERRPLRVIEVFDAFVHQLVFDLNMRGESFASVIRVDPKYSVAQKSDDLPFVEGNRYLRPVFGL